MVTIGRMSAPEFVPASVVADKFYRSPPRRKGEWRADRPGEVVDLVEQPTGPALGNQGPDQGYVLKLARRFVDDLVLAPGEHEADVIAGAVAVALRRASLFGRGPVSDDLRIALILFGYLDTAPDDLVAFRRNLFDEVHLHVVHYREVREIAATVPESTLRSSVDAVLTQHEVDWRQPLGV